MLNQWESKIGLMALAEFKPELVMIAGLRRRKFDIKSIIKRRHIGLLFYVKILQISFFLMSLISSCSQILQSVDLDITTDDVLVQETFEVIERAQSTKRKQQIP